MDHTTWHVTVTFMDGETDSVKGAHRIRYDGDWIIVDRWDGDYGNEDALRSWSYHGSQVRVVSQI